MDFKPIKNILMVTWDDYDESYDDDYMALMAQINSNYESNTNHKFTQAYVPHF